MPSDLNSCDVHASDAEWCYILVSSSTEGWELFDHIRQADIPARIAPVPRGIQACCGMCIRTEAMDAPRAERVAEQVGILPTKLVYKPKPHRSGMRFC